MGLTFPNPLGLAAGLRQERRRHRRARRARLRLRRGRHRHRPAQPGNPRPRLFRLPADRAIVNRMGFNNDGAEVVAERLRGRGARRARPASRRTPCVVGVNIGKSKVVPEDDEQAVLADYATSARLLAPYADYLVVNVVLAEHARACAASRPSTGWHPCVEEVRRAADEAAGRHVPLCVKIAPDLADDDVRGRRRAGPRPWARRPDRHQHHDLPRRAAHHRPAEVEAARRRRPVRAGAAAAVARRAAAAACRATRTIALVSVGGIVDRRRRPRAARRRRRPSCRPTPASSTAVRSGPRADRARRARGIRQDRPG